MLFFLPKLTQSTSTHFAIFVFIAIYGKFSDYILILNVKHLEMTVYT